VRPASRRVHWHVAALFAGVIPIANNSGGPKEDIVVAEEGASGMQATGAELGGRRTLRDGTGPLETSPMYGSLWAARGSEAASRFPSRRVPRPGPQCRDSSRGAETTALRCALLPTRCDARARAPHSTWIPLSCLPTRCDARASHDLDSTLLPQQLAAGPTWQPVDRGSPSICLSVDRGSPSVCLSVDRGWLSVCLSVGRGSLSLCASWLAVCPSVHHGSQSDCQACALGRRRCCGSRLSVCA
jgi:hypothetical protein